MIMELHPALFIEPDTPTSGGLSQVRSQKPKRNGNLPLACLKTMVLCQNPLVVFLEALVLPARAGLVRQSVSPSRLTPTKRKTRLLASVLVRRPPLARLATVANAWGHAV